jgi:hypothetical protein
MNKKLRQNLQINWEIQRLPDKNWCGSPIGYTLNKSGILTPFDYANDGVWTPVSENIY